MKTKKITSKVIKTKSNIQKIDPEIIKKAQKMKKFNFASYIDNFTIEKPKEWFKKKFKSSKYFLIMMTTRNDKYLIFSVTTNEKYFEFAGGTYLIDSDLAKMDMHTGQAVLFYHQDSSIPFKVEFDLDDLVKKVDQTDKGVTLALNPVSLKGFINSQVIEKVLKGQELSNDMNFMKKLIIINLLVSGLVVVVLAKSMGWI